MTASETILQREVPELVPAIGRRVALRRLVRDRSAVLGAAIILAFLIGALGASWISPAEPDAVDFRHRFASPSAEHPLGTDNLGRDVFSRILHGSRLSIGMAVVATAGITALGLGLGLLAGMYGRGVDAVIMRLVDVLQALPTLILALVVVGVLGQGLRNLIIAIIVVAWSGYARVVRGMTLTIRERQFVEAARAAGASPARIVLRHVLPNVVGPMIVLSTLDMGRTLLAISGLSFLGFGARPPTPEWGAMLSEAKSYLDRAPQLLAYPGLAITLMVLAFNLGGDGLRDFLDPALRRQARGRVGG